MWKGLLEKKLRFNGQLVSVGFLEKNSFRLGMTSQKLVAVLLLSASVFVSVVESACPDEEDIHPCTCKEGLGWAYLFCSNIPAVSVLEKVAANSDGYIFDEVAIEESTLQYIPKVVAETIRTKALSLRKLTLSRLVEGIPNSLEELSSVRLRHVRILNGMSWEVFKNTPGLKSLVLENVSIPVIKAEFSEYVSHNLDSLSLQYCGINKIEKGAFLGFKTIRSLSLNYNNLQSLQRDFFPVPFYVRILNFESNKLTAIPDDFLTNMPALNSLYLYGNLITRLNEQAFPIYVITFVDLTDNPIKCDCYLKWMAGRTLKNIRGYCASPKRLMDKPIAKLSKDDFHC